MAWPIVLLLLIAYVVSSAHQLIMSQASDFQLFARKLK